jgi:hypothetical protein
MCQAAFITGWRSCVDDMLTNKSIYRILVNYVRRVHGLPDFQPNRIAMEAMRDALESLREQNGP